MNFSSQVQKTGGGNFKCLRSLLSNQWMSYSPTFNCVPFLIQIFSLQIFLKKINDHTFKFQSQDLFTVSADGMKTEIHVLAII
jgi:hypothetical protein